MVGLTVFITESKDGFLTGGIPGGISVHGMLLSKSLTEFEHPFLMYTSKELIEGKIVFNPYNRFPLLPFLFLGITTQTFSTDILMQAYIARLFILVFFMLTLFIVYLIIKELVSNKYIALSISLLTFSTYYLVFYNDFIFNDVPSLLGFVIALYITIKNLAKKAVLSKSVLFSFFTICLGWQPYAVYLSWFLIDATDLLLNKELKLREKFNSIFKQLSFVILVLSILWGVLILGLQLFNEWRVIGGSFWSIPSLSSGLWRSGLLSSNGHTQFQWTFDWFNFLPSQAYIILTSLVPFWPIFEITPNTNLSTLIIVMIIVFNIFRYYNSNSKENKYHLILILSGFFWTIPMRHFVAMHDFQSIFYIGFIMSTFINLFTALKIKYWNILVLNITLFYIINIAVSNHLKGPFTEVNQIIKEFRKINESLPKNSRIHFDGERKSVIYSSRYAIDLILFGNIFTSLENADFVISQKPNFEGKKITDNSKYNLFEVSPDIKE